MVLITPWLRDRAFTVRGTGTNCNTAALAGTARTTPRARVHIAIPRLRARSTLRTAVFCRSERAKPFLAAGPTCLAAITPWVPSTHQAVDWARICVAVLLLLSCPTRDAAVRCIGRGTPCSLLLAAPACCRAGRPVSPRLLHTIDRARICVAILRLRGDGRASFPNAHLRY